jgi:hypothetical protein
MGIITDILKDVPLSAVLREKLLTADKENESLKSENAIQEQTLTQKEQEIQRLKQQIQELQKLHGTPQLKFVAPFFYADGDPVPYCPRCWESDHKAIHMKPPYPVHSGPKYECPVCKNHIVHPRKSSNSSGFGFIGSR